MGIKIKNRFKNKGFTVVELLVVVVVIATIAAIVYTGYSGSTERAYAKRADIELSTLANAAKLYALKYDNYPADASRSLPASLNEFIHSDDANVNWPNAPWPGSVYDYEAWDVDNTKVPCSPTVGPSCETFQISIRFCPVGGPLTACKFPKQPWVTGFNINSAYYYCIKGFCRSHISELVTYPGYCVNCPNNQGVRYPGEP